MQNKKQTTKQKKPRPVIAWMGGKSKLVKKILQYFPHHTCYVEPFAGGASLFFAKQRVTCEVINDQNGELINLYRVIQYHLDAFIDHFMWMLSSRETFDRLKHKDLQSMTDIERAVRFYYLQKHAFGGLVTKQHFGTATVSPAKFHSSHMIQALQSAHERLKTVYIENLPWQETIKRYDRPHTLFYCDPPYWQTTGYDQEFPWHEYEQLKEVMSTSDGMIILSINDHPDIRALFAGFKIIEFDTTYTVGSGKTSAKELLIFNEHANRKNANQPIEKVIVSKQQAVVKP